MLTVTEDAVKSSIKAGLRIAVKEITPEEEPKIYVTTLVDMNYQIPCVVPLVNAETSTLQIIIRGTDKCEELYVEVKQKPVSGSVSLPEPEFTEQDVKLIALLLRPHTLPETVSPEQVNPIVVKPKIKVLKKQVYVKVTSTSETEPVIVNLNNIPEGVPPELAEVAQRYYDIISNLIRAVREKGIEVEIASNNMFLSLSRTNTRGVYYVNAYATILIERRVVRRIKISGKEMTLSIEQ